jgi:hypothetical protein
MVEAPAEHIHGGLQGFAVLVPLQVAFFKDGQGVFGEAGDGRPFFGLFHNICSFISF